MLNIHLPFFHSHPPVRLGPPHKRFERCILISLIPTLQRRRTQVVRYPDRRFLRVHHFAFRNNYHGRHEQGRGERAPADELTQLG